MDFSGTNQSSFDEPFFDPKFGYDANLEDIMEHSSDNEESEDVVHRQPNDSAESVSSGYASSAPKVPRLTTETAIFHESGNRSSNDLSKRSFPTASGIPPPAAITTLAQGTQSSSSNTTKKPAKNKAKRVDEADEEEEEVKAERKKNLILSNKLLECQIEYLNIKKELVKLEIDKLKAML
jgi:hypothetical protein